MARTVLGGSYVWHLQGEVAALRRQAAPAAPAAAPAAPPAPAAPGMSALPRTLTDDQRGAMLEVLRGETSPERALWLRVDERNAEALAYADALAGVFRDAGWKVERHGSGGIVFKPGLHILVAEEDWPAYAETAHRALDRAEVTVTTAASGYRAYYDQQKSERPGWVGARIEPGETYILIVGPNPPS